MQGHCCLAAVVQDTPGCNQGMEEWPKNALALRGSRGKWGDRLICHRTHALHRQMLLFSVISQGCADNLGSDWLPKECRDWFYLATEHSHYGC